MTTEFDQSAIPNAPLVVDAIYKGEASSAGGFDSLSALLSCGNQGGFRKVGSAKNGYKYIVLFSSLSDSDWPDSIDPYSGMVTYYGDNKNAGSDLHKTGQGGNLLLRDMFEALHRKELSKIPPVFMFTRGSVGKDVVFKGLLIPGKSGISENEDLVAIWKLKGGQRFQNYRAIFTTIDVPVVSREWIQDLQNGIVDSENAPKLWAEWRNGLKLARPLTAERSLGIRKKEEQLPQDKSGKAILQMIHDYYGEDPHGFEKCAAELVRLLDSNVATYDLTRPSRDGGRDAVGIYKVGLPDNAVSVEFAIEAKCYAPDNSVKVEHTSRLISRLRHRQFGFMVTTSYVHSQAYKEIVEDGHPVVIVCGIDIIRILSSAGYVTKKEVEVWLKQLPGA